MCHFTDNIYLFLFYPQILLRIPKIGCAVNTDETSGFQQESTEETNENCLAAAAGR